MARGLDELVQFTLSREDSEGELHLDYRARELEPTPDALGDDDFDMVGGYGQVSFEDGDSQIMVTIEDLVNGDDEPENDELFAIDFYRYDSDTAMPTDDLMFTIYVEIVDDDTILSLLNIFEGESAMYGGCTCTCTCGMNPKVRDYGLRFNGRQGLPNFTIGQGGSLVAGGGGGSSNIELGNGFNLVNLANSVSPPYVTLEVYDSYNTRVIENDAFFEGSGYMALQADFDDLPPDLYRFEYAFNSPQLGSSTY